MSDLINRTHHFAIDRIVQNFFDEAAIDLEEINRKVLEIAERRQSRAEIIECKFTAEFFQRIDKAIGLRVTGDRRSFGDLKTYLGSIQAAHLELIDDKWQKLVVAQTLA